MRGQSFSHKYSYILLLLLLVAAEVFSQNSKVVENIPNFNRKRIHFGYTIGANTFGFLVIHSPEFNIGSKVYSIEAINGNGFHTGPIMSLKLGKYFNLRTLADLSFGQRTLEYRVKVIGENEEVFETKAINTESIFLEVPILLKYRAMRQGNYAPYAIGGINMAHDWAARKKLNADELTEKIRLASFDLRHEIGFGIDYYLPYFRLSTEFKYSFGITNVLPADGTEYTSTIGQLRSRMFALSLHFEY